MGARGSDPRATCSSTTSGRPAPYPAPPCGCRRLAGPASWTCARTRSCPSGPTAPCRASRGARPVPPPVERVPLQAHPRVMRKRAAVAVEILVRLVIVVLLDPHPHAVAHKRTHAAGMCVVRRTDVGERRVVAVLVVIHALPGPVRILAEGVAHLDDRL